VKYILIKKKNLYDYRNRETSDENRKYSNIKFMLKEWMKDEVHDEANKLVENYSQQLWEKKYYYFLNVSPIIIKYVNDQLNFWKECYEEEYQIRRNIEIYNNKRRKQREEKIVMINKKLLEYENDIRIYLKDIDKSLRDYFEKKHKEIKRKNIISNYYDLNKT